ncbi:hypothetical protein RNJ44_01902 [Nakaseomyces bracarensis]|uniref:Protein NBA1 n=1 Tax=Nakaseomyces bracarensis TaxID=273131 RepID=A0ABR4NP41_9SACH
MEEYNSPSKVSLNTQRLSAMIDSLSNEDVNEQSPEVKANVLTQQNSLPLPPKSPFKNDLAVSSPLTSLQMPRSPATGNLNNRASIISNYSGIIDEGVEVSYVVRNSPANDTLASPDKRQDEGQPLLPAVPKQELTTGSTSSGVIIQPVTNAKPVGRFNSLNRSRKSYKAQSEDTSTTSPTKDTLHLSASATRAMHSSIGSGNLASESGASSYYEHGGAVSPGKKVTHKQSVDDLSSIASSTVQSTLQTNTFSNESSNVPHIRTETNDFNPTIPPRSKDRPRSRLFLDEDEEESVSPREPPGRTHINSSKSDTLQSETFYSAASFDEDSITEGTMHKKDGSPTISDEQYISRPLPVTPQYDHTINREDTLKANKSANENNKYTRSQTVEDEYEDINDGDEYEEIQYTPVHQESENMNDTPKTASIASPKKKNKKKSSKNEIRSFDIETLNHLMNVTKGTLIGSEFSNLGMKVEEKKALERLVDSLSRLTADMVLDPERYEEGLKRLDKATRALEGF